MKLLGTEQWITFPQVTQLVCGKFHDLCQSILINGNLLLYSCLGNPMDRGAWQAIVHRVPRVRHDLATKLPQHSLSRWCSFPLLLTYWKLFIMNGCWVLSNGFLHLLIGSFLFFSLLQWWITLSNFLNVETTLFIWDKYPLIVVSDFFFTHCWVQFVSILLRILHLWSWQT